VNASYLPRLKAAPALLFLLLLAPQTRAAETGPIHDQKERATAALEQTVKADPNNSELWLHLGFAHRKLGEIDQAQKAFEKAAFLNPKEEDAFYMLGLIYESKHQNPKALNAWKNYLAAETDAGKRATAENHIHHLSQ
jgi:cytochrome c-type biogenesis protein CcmH/NrfG